MFCNGLRTLLLRCEIFYHCADLWALASVRPCCNAFSRGPVLGMTSIQRIPWIGASPLTVYLLTLWVNGIFLCLQEMCCLSRTVKKLCCISFSLSHQWYNVEKSYNFLKMNYDKNNKMFYLFFSTEILQQRTTANLYVQHTQFQQLGFSEATSFYCGEWNIVYLYFCIAGDSTLQVFWKICTSSQSIYSWINFR